jgi:hypothetical protein
VNFLGIVIVKERLFESRKFKLCDLKLLLAHFKKHKINCIFLFTFMKQLKPVRDDNDKKESKKVRKFDRTKKNNRNIQKSVEKKFLLKKFYGTLKCSKFQAQQHLFYYIF